MFRNQKGQTTILMAVAIVLVIFIAISAFNLGENLVSKTRFKNLADSVSFAGSTVQQKSMETFQNIANLEPLTKIAWNLGIALDNIKNGADAVHRVAPGYDTTADILDSQLGSIMSSYNSLFSSITNNPINPTFVNANIYNELINFYLADTMIFSKNIELQNLANDPGRWLNYYSIICPAEAILQQGPVNGSDGTAPRFKWEIGLKGGKLTFRYVRRGGTAVEDASGGVFTILVSDAPKLMFQNLLPASQSTKRGKIVSYSYSYPFTEIPDNVTYDPINFAFIELEVINLVNIVRAFLMQFLGESSVKSMWQDMIDDYNGFLAFLDSNRFKAAFGINENVYQTNPAFGSLSAMKLLNLSSYKTICQNKGLDKNSSTDQQKFYHTLTLKDIFTTTTNFKTAIDTSVDRLAADRSNLSTSITTLLGKISTLNKNYNAGNNIPFKLARVPAVVYETENSSSLAPFFQVLTLVSDSINEAYSSVSDTKALIILRNSYNFNLLKPVQAFWDEVPYFFNIPIIQMEGT